MMMPCCPGPTRERHGGNSESQQSGGTQRKSRALDVTHSGVQQRALGSDIANGLAVAFTAKTIDEQTNEDNRAKRLECLLDRSVRSFQRYLRSPHEFDPQQESPGTSPAEDSDNNNRCEIRDH